MVFPSYRLNSGVYLLNGLRNSKVVLVQNSWNCCLHLFVCCFFNWRLLADNFYYPSWRICLSGVLFLRRIRQVCERSEREKKKTQFSSFPTSTSLHSPSINAPRLTLYRIAFALPRKPYQIGCHSDTLVLCEVLFGPRTRPETHWDGSKHLGVRTGI